VTTMTTDGTDDWVARQGRYRGQADARRGKRLVTVAGNSAAQPPPAEGRRRSHAGDPTVAEHFDTEHFDDTDAGSDYHLGLTIKGWL
jgi:hypothetical protein